MRILSLSIFLICGLLLPVLGADEPPPDFIEGPDGFLFTRVTDENGNSILSSDSKDGEGGSPLYEGERRDGKKVSRISLSLKNLQKKIELEKLPRSPWIKRNLGIHIGSGLIEKFLNDLGSSPEKFLAAFPGMSRDKAEILRLILFGDQIILESPDIKNGMTKGAIDLRALRRTAQNPLPDPIKVFFPVALPSYLRFNSEWFIQIVLEHFSFDIESRTIEFDPLTNTFTLTLNCRGAIIKGPTAEEGRVRELYKYADFLTYHKPAEHTNYLEEGAVGPLTVTLGLQLFQEASGLWRLRLVKPEARPEETAVSLVPKMKPAVVRMTYEKEVKDLKAKTGAMTKVQEFDISDDVLKVINQTLTGVLEDAFGSSFFPEDLGFSFSLKNFLDPSDFSEVILQGRLSDFRVMGDGLSLFMDSRTRVVRESKCIKSTLPQSNNAEAELPFEYDFQKAPWILDLQNPSNENSDIKVQIASDFIQQLHESLYRTGFYCPSTKWLWPRDPNIPRIDFVPSQIPRVDLGTNAIDFKAEGQVSLWERDFKLKPMLQIGQTLPLRVHLTLKNNSESGGFGIRGLSNFEISSMNPDANSFWQEILQAALPYAENALEFNSVEVSDWSINEFRASPQAVSLKLTWKPENRRSEEIKVERSSEIPVTVFESNLPFVIKDPFVMIQWKSNVSEAFYSWRLRKASEKNWSPWSSFSDRKFTQLVLTESGRYEFQIVAMNSFFDMEDYPKQIEFNLQLDEPLKSPTSETISPPRSPTMDEPKESVLKPAEARPANSPGLFGCQLSLSVTDSKNSPESKFHLGLIGILAGAGCVGLRLSVRRSRPRN